jgi:hypothetical protein
VRSRALRLSIVVSIVFVSIRAVQPQTGGPPGREISLPPDQVKDSFFAYAIGILVSGLEVEMSNQDLRDILTEFKTYVNLPFDLIQTVRQGRDPITGEMEFSIFFNASVKIPIPFAFLGYHPGSILATQELRFIESRPDLSISPDPSPASPIYVLRLTTGLAMVDVDDWLIFLLPRIVDDLYVDLFAIFRYKGTWYCLLSGMGKRGEQIREYFDFTRNRIVFPIPKDLEEIGAGISPDTLQQERTP